ncbi:MAG: hypothetical protein KJN68_04020 [Bacteroidia bacterium]|nr:hypothetical protein [Bacteroidia bacterium]
MKTNDMKKLTGLSFIYILILVLINVALGISVLATFSIAIILGVLLAVAEYFFGQQKVSLYTHLDKRKTIISKLERLGYTKSKKLGDKAYFINNTKAHLESEVILLNKIHFLKLDIPKTIEKYFIGIRLKSRLT